MIKIMKILTSMIQFPADIYVSCGRKGLSMDLAKQAKIVESIRETLHDFVGQRLKVRANMGRSKIVESEGVLTQVHPQLFIMEVDRKRGRTARQSYQYVDVLTGMVELSQSGEPLFEAFIEETPPETLLYALEENVEETILT